ncbi:basic leucine zipper 43-like [Aristolochia californica]|uniref:basic leucine zipper 43-like n=1 Tax=Aristolochia californica TaxID=171875 RepID=UPI0035DEC852
MQPAEVAGIHCLGPMNQNSHHGHFSAIQSNLPASHFSRFLGAYPSHHFQIPPNIYEFTPQTPSLSSNSTSDDAEEQQMSVIDERKQRRMISNRESARRSRMRKQKHLDELWSQVVRLRTENRQLIDKLNDVSECHERVVHENVKLREEASQLRETLKDLHLDNPYSVLRDLEELPCNTAHLRAESTNQPIITSMDLLH